MGAPSTVSGGSGRAVSSHLRRAAVPGLIALAAYLVVAAVLARDGYDFRIFYAAGHAVAHGRSPIRRPPPSFAGMGSSTRCRRPGCSHP